MAGGWRFKNHSFSLHQRENLRRRSIILNRIHHVENCSKYRSDFAARKGWRNYFFGEG